MSQEQSCGRGQLRRSQYYGQGGRGFSQIRCPYSYSLGYGVGDPPQTQQHFDGGWCRGYGQQGAYNGTISRQGNQNGGMGKDTRCLMLAET